MICQRCSSPATVHLTDTQDGEIVEIHLCEACARKEGVPLGTKPPALGLQGVVQGLIVAHVGELVGEVSRRVCPDCGLSFLEYRVGGRLGCPRDYEAFGPGILALLRRAHGSSRHVGKRPRRKEVTASPLLRMRAQLRRAIESEDYELAARLRDQLRQEGSVA